MIIQRAWRARLGAVMFAELMPRSIDPALIPNDVRFVAEKLGAAGFGAWVVGGCVRDLLLGREVHDWDLATSAHPEDVQRIFRRTIPTGIKHGTVSVMLREGRNPLDQRLLPPVGSVPPESSTTKPGRSLLALPIP